MKTTPVTTFDRTKVVLNGVAKVGLVKAKEFSKRAFLSKEERELQKDEAQNEIGTIIYENLSLLRGTAVKIAQALSLHNILPPNIQKELSKSYNSIEPIDQALVIKVVQNEYGRSYKEVFKEFHLKPFASASLGRYILQKLMMMRSWLSK